MTYCTIDELRESLAQPAQKVRTPEYIAKMMHEVPNAPSIDRAEFILSRCKGQRVLEFGASGPLHEAIVGVAQYVFGVDRCDGAGVVGFDLDRVCVFESGDLEVIGGLPPFDEPFVPDVIVCGEVIEHLANPGWFLQRLQRQCSGVPAIITVPNAFSAVAQKHLRDGIENVNRDHVAWYSPMTLKTLLARYGYDIAEFYWYNGEPLTAEGLIVVTKG